MESFRDFLIERFGLLQIGISAFFIVFWLWSRSKEASKSGFKVREADRDLKFSRGEPGSADKTERKKAPLRLAGIVKDGAPHEVLGVSALASEAEIKTAYKQKMKQYHPDRIGAESTQIAEAINRARNEMLEKLKRRS